MFLEIDKRRAINLLNFEIKAHTKEWKVIFKSDSSHSIFLSHLLLKSEQANYKNKRVIFFENITLFIYYSNLSPSLGINITISRLQSKVLYIFHLSFVCTVVCISFPLHHDLQTILI